MVSFFDLQSSGGAALPGTSGEAPAAGASPLSSILNLDQLPPRSIAMLRPLDQVYQEPKTAADEAAIRLLHPSPVAKTLVRMPTGSTKHGMVDLQVDFDHELTAGAMPVVHAAAQYLRTPYLWGGADPRKGFDMPGFVRHVYRQEGLNLPHTIRGQLTVGTHVAESDLQPGDTIFLSKSGKFPKVGIYLGNQQFLHASRSGKAVKVSSLNDPYYNEQFMGGRRYEPPQMPGPPYSPVFPPDDGGHRGNPDLIPTPPGAPPRGGQITPGPQPGELPWGGIKSPWPPGTIQNSTPLGPPLTTPPGQRPPDSTAPLPGRRGPQLPDVTPGSKPTGGRLANEEPTEDERDAIAAEVFGVFRQAQEEGRDPVEVFQEQNGRKPTPAEEDLLQLWDKFGRSAPGSPGERNVQGQIDKTIGDIHAERSVRKQDLLSWLEGFVGKQGRRPTGQPGLPDPVEAAGPLGDQLYGVGREGRPAPLSPAHTAGEDYTHVGDAEYMAEHPNWLQHMVSKGLDVGQEQLLADWLRRHLYPGRTGMSNKSLEELLQEMLGKPQAGDEQLIQDIMDVTAPPSGGTKKPPKKGRE